ncbi:MAG: BMP family ABC transporter substrate-binding protein, partial [Bacilli bacterium]
MVTDSGTLNDHSFNESAWNGINAFAAKNGGVLNSTTNVCDTGIVQTKYYQPAEDAYTTPGRVAAIRSAVTWGAKVVILPGYLFQSAIKTCLDDVFYKDTYFLALDCTKSDSDNNYAPYDYTAKVTSVIYREEQAGFEAGYAAVKEGYRKLGFCGGMAVPAVVRYGSGYCQGADIAAQELKLADNSIGIQYYYAGQFKATDTATSYCTSWYQAGTEVIFGCGGAVYNSVIAGSQASNNKPWIGVDVNQHADSS